MANVKHCASPRLRLVSYWFTIVGLVGNGRSLSTPPFFFFFFFPSHPSLSPTFSTVPPPPDLHPFHPRLEWQSRRSFGGWIFAFWTWVFCERLFFVMVTFIFFFPLCHWHVFNEAESSVTGRSWRRRRGGGRGWGVVRKRRWTTTDSRGDIDFSVGKKEGREGVTGVGCFNRNEMHEKEK